MLRVLDTRAKRLLFCGLGLSGFAPLNDASARGLELLYSFSGQPDGALPNASLVADKTGNLYGTTNVGGVSNDGSVFKLSPDGSETVLYSFRGRKDGLGPNGGLIADKTGNLYGPTAWGGGNGCNGQGCGTIFRLTPSGSETTLYSFTGGNDGSHPWANVISDKKGNLFGTTEFGGADGTGVVFMLAPGGTEAVLYDFMTGTNGREPIDGLMANGSGILFGTARMGGASNKGTVFELKE